MRHSSIPLLSFVITFWSCNHEYGSQEMLAHKVVPNRITTIPLAKLTDGYSVPVDKRFNLKCVFFGGVDISDDVNPQPKDDAVLLKLLSPEKFNISNNDTLKIFFQDPRKIVWESGAIKLVDLILRKQETACDTIVNILYDDISNKTESILTDTSVNIVQLFGLTTSQKIKAYLKALKSRHVDISDCSKSLFILDLVNESSKPGFAQNQNVLTDDLKKYLDMVANVLWFKIKQHKWELSKFVVQCSGAADERQYTGAKDLQSFFSEENDSIQPVYKMGCGTMTQFATLGSANEGMEKLNYITDNCDLTVMRAFASVNYLKRKLDSQLKNKIIFQYEGYGPIRGEDYDANRKIDLHLSLKAVTDNE